MTIKEWVQRHQKVLSRLNAQRNAAKAEANQLDNDFVNSSDNEVSIHYGPDKLPIRLEEKVRVRELLL